jgi:UDP-2,3-diacylglucosamine hydrolase
MQSILHCPCHWHTLDFISDLHLSSETPIGQQTTQAWARYMAHTPAQAVFILGDWFDVWIGDDVVQGGFEASCAQVLTQAASRGVSVWVMTGNRDFLMGSAYLSLCQANALEEPTVLCLPDGQRGVLTHGDRGCLADQAYQIFRSQVRSPTWQTRFLSQPRWQRQAQGRALRAQTRGRGGNQYVAEDGEMLDLDPEWINQLLVQTDSTFLIHGHTHRLADHVQAGHKMRYTLGDWHAPHRLPVLRWQRDLSSAQSVWLRV